MSRPKVTCGAVPFLQCLPFCTTEVLLTIADFDDPNIDRDGAIVGILGEYICLSFSWYTTSQLLQRMIHHTQRSVVPSLTRMTHPFLATLSAPG